MNKKKIRKPNDQRADVKNKNNIEFELDRLNRIRQKEQNT